MNSNPQYAKGSSLNGEAANVSRSRLIGWGSQWFWRAAYVVVYCKLDNERNQEAVDRNAAWITLIDFGLRDQATVDY